MTIFAAIDELLRGPRSLENAGAPLVVGEAYPPFKNGLPKYAKLRNAAVPKKLTTEFEI